jgi:hypothetical protein
MSVPTIKQRLDRARDILELVTAATKVEADRGSDGTSMMWAAYRAAVDAIDELYFVDEALTPAMQRHPAPDGDKRDAATNGGGR